MRNTVLSPGRLSHSTVPPWAVTISRTIARPRPLPPGAVSPGTRKYRSKTSGRYSAGIPEPVSATEKTTLPSAGFRGQRDPPALGRVGQGVVQQVLQGVLELVGVDGHAAASRRPTSKDELDAAIGGPRPERVGRRLQQRRGPLRLQVELAPPLLQPRQVQQVVDHRQQPLGVVAGVDQQFQLLGRQRPDRSPPRAGAAPGGCWSAASSTRG